MARRIGLAQALINDPDILILDEPTSGMDPIGTRQMKDLILQLAQRGKTILLCSHLLADVEDVCDRIGILYGGRMQLEGSVDSLLEKKEETQILTSSLSDSAIEKIKAIVKAENSDCSITSPMDKLEDFFIRTVINAQQSKQSTGGAVNTGPISGFLTEEKPRHDDVLDNLVNATVDEVPSSGIDVTKTEKPDTTHQVDGSILQELTGSLVQKPESDTSRPTPPLDAAEPTESEINEDILNKLTGESKDD
jgi:ABC-2 type transport system ATP-binding protein